MYKLDYKVVAYTIFFYQAETCKKYSQQAIPFKHGLVQAIIIYRLANTYIIIYSLYIAAHEFNKSRLHILCRPNLKIFIGAYIIFNYIISTHVK
jgi:hypothetical protein